MNNYKSLYYKYKTKYINLKNNIKGGMFTNTLTGKPIMKIPVPSNRSFFKFIMKFLNHQYISKLSSKKIVATPNSGSEPMMFLNSWEELDEENKFFLCNFWFPTRFGIELGIFIHPEAKNPEKRGSINPIIFYSVEHLDMLAIASGITKEELLSIMVNIQNHQVEKFNHDLILIAFGDVFDNGLGVTDIQTPEGEEILRKYKELAEI